MIFVPSRARSPEEELARVRAALWTTAHRYEHLTEAERASWIRRAVANDAQALEVVTMWAQWLAPLGPDGVQRAHDTPFATHVLEACLAASAVPFRLALIFETLHYLPLLADAAACATLRSKTDAKLFDESLARLRARGARDVAARAEADDARRRGESL